MLNSLFISSDDKILAWSCLSIFINLAYTDIVKYSGVNSCNLVNPLLLSPRQFGLTKTYQSLDSLKHLKPLFFRRFYKQSLSLYQAIVGRSAREKIWRVSAAALPGWLQVFASPHFSRLPSLFYLEISPLSPQGDGGFAFAQLFIWGYPPDPLRLSTRLNGCSAALVPDAAPYHRASSTYSAALYLILLRGARSAYSG